MKLIIIENDETKEVLEYLAKEICLKYEVLNPKVTIDELGYDLELEKGEGNFVYISNLDITGNIANLGDLKKYQRIIYVAEGKKYQNLLKRIFNEEKNAELLATYLFDLRDVYIVTDKLGSTKI